MQSELGEVLANGRGYVDPRRSPLDWASRENEECNRHFRAGAVQLSEGRPLFPRSERRERRTGMGTSGGHATTSAALATIEVNLAGVTEERHCSADVWTIKLRDLASRDGSKRHFDG